MATLTNKRPRSDSDGDETDTSTIFRTQENFAKFLIIESTNKDKPITSLSPFVIEKQIEALIGTVKSVKKLRNQTLLVETTRKSQTENLLRTKTFFNLPVQVSEHKTLNSSKGIIRDRALKGESDDNIRENLQEQGVIAAKRFKVKKVMILLIQTRFYLHSILWFHKRLSKFSIELFQSRCTCQIL